MYIYMSLHENLYLNYPGFQHCEIAEAIALILLGIGDFTHHVLRIG
jgi:hypothetical protein